MAGVDFSPLKNEMNKNQKEMQVFGKCMASLCANLSAEMAQAQRIIRAAAGETGEGLTELKKYFLKIRSEERNV